MAGLALPPDHPWDPAVTDEMELLAAMFPDELTCEAVAPPAAPAPAPTSNGASRTHSAKQTSSGGKRPEAATAAGARAVAADDSRTLSDSREVAALTIRVAPEVEAPRVWAVLRIGLPAGYPTILPAFSIVASRGIGDADLAKLLAAVGVAASEAAGSAGVDTASTCVFAAIEAAREFINTVNFDDSKHECGVCLQAIAVDQTVVTPCHHTFHNECVGRWVSTVIRDAEIALSEHDPASPFLKAVAAAEQDEIRCTRVVEDARHRVGEVEASLRQAQTAKASLQAAKAAPPAPATAAPAKPVAKPPVNADGSTEPALIDPEAFQRALAQNIPRFKEDLRVAREDLKTARARHYRACEKVNEARNRVPVCQVKLESPCPVCRVPLPEDLCKALYDHFRDRVPPQEDEDESESSAKAEQEWLEQYLVKQADRAKQLAAAASVHRAAIDAAAGAP